MADPARKLATYGDVLAAPPNMTAQVIGGDLHLQPRPSKPHTIATSALGEELGPPFKRGRGGPGGWMILDEPELHLGDDIVVPDLAGWRRERMQNVVDDLPYFTLAPDWVAEVLSPFTTRLDRTKKPLLYAQAGVSWLWLSTPWPRHWKSLNAEIKVNGCCEMPSARMPRSMPARSTRSRWT